ncbi:MAG: cell division protein ZipA [Proteobacteria bacterium]|nr:cell division protein ZipA [Pseudomonadota bacterium]
MSLRTLLLIIGAIIVVAVYAFTAIKRRRDARVHYDRRFRMDMPDAMLRHDGEDDGGDTPRLTGRGEGFDEIIAIRTLSPDDVPPVKPAPRKGLIGKARAAAAAMAQAAQPGTPAASEDAGDFQAPPPREPSLSTLAVEDEPPLPSIKLPHDVVLPPQHEALAELPAVRNDVAPTPEPSNARKRTDQLDLFGEPLDAAPPEPAAVRRRTYKEPSAEPETGLISLYVRAHEGKEFSGTTLVKALNAVGMQFGDMAIFHHFGAGELKCQNPVFSAANMFEPGTFDMRRIEAFRTAGVALFLQLPGPLDGPVAFELLLNTAQRLTELTGGELYVDPKNLLDPPSIARLRKRAARFAHGRR